MTIAIAAILSLMLLTSCVTPSQTASLDHLAQYSPEKPIWASGEKTWLSPEDLIKRLSAFDTPLLIGEIHDNPHHHQVQASLLAAKRGQKNSPPLRVGMEHLRVDQEPILELWRSRQGDLNALREALRWHESGWGEFSMYAPIFEQSLDAGIDLSALNFSAATSMDIYKRGAQAALPELQENPENAFSDQEKAAMVQDIINAHCNLIDEKVARGMISIQMARDAYLAHRIVEKKVDVALMGSGHARKDRAVPMFLARNSMSSTVVALSELPLADGNSQTMTLADTRHFDFVWYTSAHRRKDPCSDLEKHFSAKQKS